MYSVIYYKQARFMFIDKICFLLPANTLHSASSRCDHVTHRATVTAFPGSARRVHQSTHARTLITQKIITQDRQTRQMENNT